MLCLLRNPVYKHTGLMVDNPPEMTASCQRQIKLAFLRTLCLVQRRIAKLCKANLDESRICWRRACSAVHLEQEESKALLSDSQRRQIASSSCCPDPQVLQHQLQAAQHGCRTNAELSWWRSMCLKPLCTIAFYGRFAGLHEVAFSRKEFAYTEHWTNCFL